MSHYTRKIAAILHPRRCELQECRKQFMPTTYHQRFCCRQHLNKFHNLIISNARALKRIKKYSCACTTTGA